MARAAHVPRVFVPASLRVDSELVLPEAKRHHLATVLRVAAGASIALFNGDGHEYAARVLEADRKRVRIAVEARAAPRRESALEVTLVQAIARGDRMDFALAKAVELGAHAICPVFAARGKVRLDGARAAKKHAHWQGVVESAAEQSGRLICPRLAPAADLSAVLAEPAADAAELRLMLSPGASHGLGALHPARRVRLLVGPESGLADREIDAARVAGWHALALGPRVLRTETAGVAALSALQACWGDLG